MGKLNILKAAWVGKVGQTVGAKWKNKNTIRTYAIPSNPKTQPQQGVRGAFKQMTSLVALFADQIKYLTSLDTRGQSVRNAIIKNNSQQIMDKAFDATTLVINKGGLPALANLQVTPQANNVVNVTWQQPTATNITDKAKVICVVVDSVNKIAVTSNVLANIGTTTLTCTGMRTGVNVNCYVWMIDYRGSARVGNISVHNNVQIQA